MNEKMTLKEVAALLECTEETVIDKAGAGKLAAIRFGRSWVFLRAALMEGLHQTALANLKLPESSPPAPTPPALPMAYADPIPQSKRTSASKRRQSSCPDLPPVDSWR